jgi:DNA end-binding protein Ku
VHFNLLHRETLSRVKQAWCANGKVVKRADLVRGYQVERDRYVVVGDDELAALKVESTKVIDIERFVDCHEIDRLYWDEPFFLVPDGKQAQDPYAVIREAMAGGCKVALGRLVMAHRERIVAVEARGRGMLLSTLHSADEVRSEEEAFDAVTEVRVDARMVEIARQIIGQIEGPFEPASFADRYKEAVRALVQSKTAGETAVHRPAPEPAESNVIDLMEALRRSLKGAPRAEAPAEPSRSKPPARKSTAKPAAAKKPGKVAAARRPPACKEASDAPRRAAG